MDNLHNREHILANWKHKRTPRGSLDPAAPTCAPAARRGLPTSAAAHGCSSVGPLLARGRVPPSPPVATACKGPCVAIPARGRCSRAALEAVGYHSAWPPPTTARRPADGVEHHTLHATAGVRWSHPCSISGGAPSRLQDASYRRGPRRLPGSPARDWKP